MFENWWKVAVYLGVVLLKIAAVKYELNPKPPRQNADVGTSFQFYI